MAAFEILCGDPDPDVRYYAVHALVEEGLECDAQRLRRILVRLMDDSDEQVRALVREHAARIRARDLTGVELPITGEFERVYIELQWYDGPRHGIADAAGVPHYFRAVHDYRRDDGLKEEFQVWPATGAVVTEEVEQWRIFVEWERRHRSGQTAAATHPGLGGIDARFDALEATLTGYRIPPLACRILRAVWYPLDLGTHDRRLGPPYVVRWW